MKRQQFTGEQIIGILKEAEAGAVVTELWLSENGAARREAEDGRASRRRWG
jgi:hypothetical protein